MKRILIAAILSSCSPEPKADIWSDNGEIRISVPDNPSSGYRWKLVGADICDSAGFEYKQKVEPGDSGKAICGRGGTSAYVLVPKKGISLPASDSIELVLSRGGEDVAEKRSYLIGFR